MEPVMNKFILCTDSSARSIPRECLLARLGEAEISTFSTGCQPVRQDHPQALVLLKVQGFETGALASKSWDIFAASDAPAMDVMTTVCGSAAAETCPMCPSTPMRAHLGVEDPAAVREDAAPQAFRSAYDILHRRAVAFTKAPLAQMDRTEIQAHLIACGTLP
jgi:arsenate reductase